MKEFDKTLIQDIMIQHEERKVWQDNDTNEYLDNFILEEYTELKEALNLSFLGESAFALASELGDVFYLYIKRITSSDEPIPLKVMMAVNDAEEIAEIVGIDHNECARMKLIRNELKYPHLLFDGDIEYEKGRGIAKKQWEMMGGDKTFSYVYEQLIENLES